MQYDCVSQGNLFYGEANPYRLEKESIVNMNFEVKYELKDTVDHGFWYFTLDDSLDSVKTLHVTTSVLVWTKISKALLEDYDGKPLSVDIDSLGQHRNLNHPLLGPINNLKQGQNVIKLW